MRDAFIVWITIQLMLIGMMFVSIENGIMDNTWECSEGEEVALVWGAIFPLIAFIPEHQSITNYCKTNKPE